MHIISQVRFLVTAIASNRVGSLILYGSICGLHSKGKIMESAKTPNGVLRRVDDVIKSAEDKGSYRGLELKNHMKVLLVSDPTTDRSAASMDVNIGYLSDPDDLPGLAHFCEHMLFLGTQKFPNENDYTKFLTEHGGSSNAATYTDHTNFYFDIVPDQLFNALDRFSQFFIAPLFTASATEREINAVNSEHEKNIASDMWRLDQLDRHSGDQNHPFHKFGTGNKNTLWTLPREKNIDVREELLQFHSKWYSSNVMALAILGKESLDELQEIVVKLFSDVEDKGVEAPRWEEHPFKEEHYRTYTFVCPIKDIQNLSIIFPSRDLQEYYKSVPSHYISHLIGHEGPGSILSALKARGWSNNLLAGNRPASRGFGFFGISVDLTDEGLKHTDEIIQLIFQYIKMLKNDKPFKWIQDEQRDISAMVFRFKDKESPRMYISSIVHNLHEFPLEEVLCGNFLVSDWRPDVIEELLNEIVPEKVRISIIAKQYENEADQTEPWYGTKYSCKKIPEDTLKKWNEAELSEEFKFPAKNEFIPTNFDLYPQDNDAAEHPKIIQDTSLTRVWFKQDDKYLLPKANLMFDFVSPLAYLDPLNCNLTHMFVQLFRDSLNEYGYAADLAGLKWNLTNTKYGLILGIGGYNNKQHILLDKILEKLSNFKVDPKRFAVYKENYIRTLKNFAAEQPYQHAVYYLAVLLTEHSWMKQELLGAIDQVTIENLEAFIPQMLSKMHIECLIHGNFNKEKALELVKIVEDHLISTVKFSPLLPRQLLLNRELKLEGGCNYMYEVNNDYHKSSCIELYYQCGLQSKENNMKLELLSQIMHEPCFDQLRTKEQLGYIVFSGLRRSNGVQGFRVIIQSEKHPTYLDSRIEAFLENMFEFINGMSEEEFSRHKEALAAQRLEKPKQLSGQTSLYWGEITAQQYHFDRANEEVAYLRTITKDEILTYYKETVGKTSELRRKVGVHVVSLAEGGAGKQPDSVHKGESSAQFIDDVTVFKSTHEMHPLVQPYINITRKGNKCKL